MTTSPSLLSLSPQVIITTPLIITLSLSDNKGRDDNHFSQVRAQGVRPQADPIIRPMLFPFHFPLPSPGFVHIYEIIEI